MNLDQDFENKKSQRVKQCFQKFYADQNQYQFLDHHHLQLSSTNLSHQEKNIKGKKKNNDDKRNNQKYDRKQILRIIAGRDGNKSYLKIIQKICLILGLSYTETKQFYNNLLKEKKLQSCKQLIEFYFRQYNLFYGKTLSESQKLKKVFLLFSKWFYRKKYTLDLLIKRSQIKKDRKISYIQEKNQLIYMQDQLKFIASCIRQSLNTKIL